MLQEHLRSGVLLDSYLLTYLQAHALTGCPRTAG